MSLEPNIAIETDNPLVNQARIRMVARHRRVFFQVSARKATRREGTKWNLLLQDDKAQRIAAETTVGEAMGVPMIPVCFQTIENFREWVVKQANPAKYLTPQPA